MKRSQLNLALLGVAAALGVTVFLSQKKEEKGPPLTSLAQDAIDKIAIDHPGKPAITLEKHNGQWKLTAPVQTDADAVEVGGILSLATLETKSTLDASARPADLGLAPPDYSVTLNDQKLELGAVEPLKYRRYVATGGKILLVEDPPSAALDADYSDLVAKNLLPDNAEIQKITLPGLEVARAVDGKNWTLTPDNPGATSDQKSKLVDGWKTARAMWNAAEPAEGSKGDEVIITLKDRELKFIIAQRDPQLVLARPDLKLRYTLSKALEDQLLKLPEEKKAAAAPLPAELMPAKQP